MRVQLFCMPILGMRKTRNARNHRGGAKKPPALCQCPKNSITEEPCREPVVPKTLFCKEHQNCPPPPINGWEPIIDEKQTVWNTDTNVRKSHNCYSFAMMAYNREAARKCKEKGDCRKYFPQPGALSGQRDALNTNARRQCPNVERLMISDNPDIYKSKFYEPCKPGFSKIYMKVAPGNDYHYWVQALRKVNKTMKNGMHVLIPGWLDKPGGNRIKSRDALGQLTFHPGQAVSDFRFEGSDLNYTDSCGSYCVPRDRLVSLGQGGGAAVQRGRRSRRQRRQTMAPRRHLRKTRKQSARK